MDMVWVWYKRWIGVIDDAGGCVVLAIRSYSQDTASRFWQVEGLRGVVSVSVNVRRRDRGKIVRL